MSTIPGALVHVLYKRTPDVHFDVDYFLSHHIPIARKAMQPYGLIDAYATEAIPDCEFAHGVTMMWKDLEGWEKANKDENMMAELLGDVANYTNATPVWVISKVLT